MSTDFWHLTVRNFEVWCQNLNVKIQSLEQTNYNVNKLQDMFPNPLDSPIAKNATVLAKENNLWQTKIRERWPAINRYSRDLHGIAVM